METKLITYKNGDKEWRLPNGKRHREDGPAVEYVNGDKSWYINGLNHREDGPAIEYVNGIKKWFLYGISYTEQQYKYKMRSIKLTKILK